MNFLRLTIRDLDEMMQEILIAKMSMLPFDGFEQKEDHLLAYAEEHKVNTKALKEILKNNSYTVETIPNVNWNEKWEQDYEPIIIEELIGIRAHFHPPISNVKNEIVITPKMSFGTGHHATTQLMLKQMNKLDWLDKNVFDYGTGTGVLSIYAEQLGAKQIIANDIDPWSVDNTKENITRNNAQHIDVRLGSIEVVPEEHFDGILANINLNVLKESLPLLFKKLNKGQNGLLLSGVLVENEKDIIREIEVYSTDYHIVMLDKWLCIAVNF